MFLKKSKVISILKKWKVMEDVDELLLKKITVFYGIRTFSGLNPKYSVVFYTSDDNRHVAGFNNFYNVLNLSGPQRGAPFEVDYPIKIGYNSGLKKLVVTERFGVQLARGGQLSYWGMELSSEQYENPDQVILEFTSGLSDDYYDDVFCGGYSFICVNSEGIWIKGWLDPAPHTMANGYSYDYYRLTTKEGLVAKSISCGAYHVAILDQHNEVWTFGFGLTGQLGYHWSSGDGFEKPLKVFVPRPCIKVECGAYTTLFLLDNGEVYGCGRNSEYDNLCVGTTENVFKPAKVRFEDPIADIAASYLEDWGKWPTRFGAVSRDHRKYFVWGENHPGETPTWKTDIDNLFDIFVHFMTPHSLSDLDHEEPNESETIQSSANLEILPATILDKWSLFKAMPGYLRTRVQSFTVFGTGYNSHLLGGFVITSDDDIFGVGINDSKSLGVPGNNPNFAIYPNEIRSLAWKKITRIVLNLVKGVALTRSGLVYAWEGSQGPAILDSMQDTQVIDLSAGAKFFLFLDADGKVYFDGLMSSDYPEEEAKEISLPENEKAVQIASGEWHGAVLTSAGDVYTFGHGIYSQLGYPWESSDSPYEARKVALPGPCKKIACGVCSTLFVMENGDLYACGLNKYADVLGVGHGDTVLEPQKVKIAEPVVDVAVGIRNASFGARVSSFAVKTASGNFYKWGSEVYEPKLLQGISSLVEAFADQEMPHSLSMVPIAPPIQPKPDSGEEENDYLNEISEEDLNRLKAGGIPYSDLGDPLFSDVTLKLSDGTQAAHKCFLVPKSKFFREAIHKAEADGSSDVDLTQYNPNAIRALLKYAINIFNVILWETEYDGPWSGLPVE
ncbi:Hypothetical protein chromosome condensation (RCC1) and BTB (POZ) domain containing protein [Nesidiocoris tenuis]|uniref:BTB domain-containing protein n=1 Tax=Nesidiocoris tenuis TaxID=355587 RepID=A0ABN7AXY1_9HEMI|nr:Hypothetical protein chromosome condensation (RCC1) and BTB (POZ) domain containing protein [Nesidiocoris tenuis]